MDNTMMQLEDSTEKAIAGEEVKPAQDVMKDLICAVCLFPAFGGVATPCEHYFHKECLRPAIQSSAKCPSCSTPQGDSPFKPFPRVVNNILNECPVHCPQSCGQQVAWENLEKHVKTDCPRTKFGCANDGCPSSALPRKEAASHAEACDYKLVACKCGMSIRKRELAEHKKAICAKEFVSCSLCGKSGIQRECMDAHLRKDCSAPAIIAQVKQLEETVSLLQNEIKRMKCILNVDIQLPTEIQALPLNAEGLFHKPFPSTEWGLKIYPKGVDSTSGAAKGQYVSIFLTRETGQPGPVNISIRVDNSSQTSQGITVRSQGWGWNKFAPISAIASAQKVSVKIEDARELDAVTSILL